MEPILIHRDDHSPLLSFSMCVRARLVEAINEPNGTLTFFNLQQNEIQ